MLSSLIFVPWRLLIFLLVSDAGNVKANAKQMKQKLAWCAVPKCALGALVTQLTFGMIQMVNAMTAIL